jgi:hypothetical protein
MLEQNLSTRELATDVFLAEHICNRAPLQLNPTRSALQASLLMQLFQLEQAPIENSNGQQIVRHSDILGTSSVQFVSAFATETPAEHWITHTASLHDALEQLGQRGWLFVRSKDTFIGTISRLDLGRPIVSTYLFAVILDIERGLRRLYGSYVGQPIPDEPAGYPAGRDNPGTKADTFETAIKYVCSCEPLIDALGFTGKSKARDALYRIKKLHDDLAHARTVLEFREEFGATVRRIRNIESIASHVRGLLLDRESIWHAYANTTIHAAEDQLAVLAGVGAKTLSMLPPVFAISAQNPHEQFLGEDENTRRTEILGEYLKAIPEISAIEKVIGRSADPITTWAEESWAVSGLTRAQALEVGRLFGQRAIFELTEHEKLTISADGRLVFTSQRNAA